MQSKLAGKERLSFNTKRHADCGCSGNNKIQLYISFSKDLSADKPYVRSHNDPSTLTIVCTVQKQRLYRLKKSFSHSCG